MFKNYLYNFPNENVKKKVFDIITQHKKNVQWKKLSNLEDTYINACCARCEKLKNLNDLYLVIYDEQFKILCENCKKEFEKLPDFVNSIKINQISKEIILELMNKKKVKNIISGKSIYIGFCIKIKNYREKLGYCNM
ncbi:MAG: hypothetical protein ACTSRZ_15315 [Promethearchaeota archaeon]